MFKLNNYYHPADGESSAVEDKELSKDETIKFLNDDSEEKEEVLDLKDDKKTDKSDKEDDETGDEVAEEKDELDEIEEELEDVDEEKLELMAPARRKDILKEFPELFKKFPYLERAYYREQQFTELLPTIEDAKEAVQGYETLQKFQADLTKGDLTTALRAVKASSEDSFAQLTDNYLPTLAKVDKEAYFHIVGNVIKSTIADALRAGKDSKNEDLVLAAGILGKYIFNTEDPGAPTNLSRPKSDTSESDKINEERLQLQQERFEESRDSINTRVGNTLKSTIEANIDPKESMTDYVKRTAIRDCQEKLEEALSGDKRLSTIIDRLWLKARDEKFSKSSLEKIKSAYLSGARTLLPTVLKQARNEALKGLGKRVKDDDEVDTTSKRGPSTGRVASNKSTNDTGRSTGKSDREKAAAIPKGMSSRDFLNAD